jgi:hypothetical protein
MMAEITSSSVPYKLNCQENASDTHLPYHYTWVGRQKWQAVLSDMHNNS